MKLIFSVTEEELIKGCIKNERLAQKRLYERYYSKMMGVCMRYASHREQATEMLNLGFLKVFNSIQKYAEKGSNLEAWMYRIMVNTAIDYLRAEIRHQHADIEKSVYVEDTADVLADLATEQIMAMINELTPAYRAVFNLYVIEGYNHAEIGKLLGINEGTSKSNLAKARAKLQEKIIQLNKVNLGVYGNQF
ncbi:MAG: RNA polymerase sigma factor [Chitinophagales bacterium]